MHADSRPHPHSGKKKQAKDPKKRGRGIRNRESGQPQGGVPCRTGGGGRKRREGVIFQKQKKRTGGRTRRKKTHETLHLFPIKRARRRPLSHCATGARRVGLPAQIRRGFDKGQAEAASAADPVVGPVPAAVVVVVVGRPRCVRRRLPSRATGRRSSSSRSSSYLSRLLWWGASWVGLIVRAPGVLRSAGLVAGVGVGLLLFGRCPFASAFPFPSPSSEVASLSFSVVAFPRQKKIRSGAGGAVWEVCVLVEFRLASESLRWARLIFFWLPCLSTAKKKKGELRAEEGRQGRAFASASLARSGLRFCRLGTG